MQSMNLGRVRGTMWYTGTAMTTADNQSRVYSDSGITYAYLWDMYLNTATGNVFQCTKAGDPWGAEWLFAGNLLARPEMSTDLTQNSRLKAASEYSANLLYQMITGMAVYPTKVHVDFGEKAYSMSITLENINSTVTITDVDGNVGTYTATASGSDLRKTFVITIGNTIGLPNGAIIKQINTTGAKIFDYALYNSSAEVIYDTTPHIWTEINNLEEDVAESTTISETYDEETASYLTGIFSKIIYGVRNTIYLVTHAKAVWYNKLENLTVYDKIVEMESRIEQLEEALEDLDSE